MPPRRATVLVCITAILGWAGTARADESPVWREGFEQGLGTARPYHADAPTTALTLITNAPAEGRQAVRATLPGQRRLEGFALVATLPAGPRLATVRARVRGHGDVWLCLYSRNGWLYAPEVTRLSAQWQFITMRKVLVQGDRSLGINFLTRDVQPGAVFEVDDVSVAVEPPLLTWDTAAGPWQFEAEDFTTRAGERSAEAGASGGQVVRGDSYLRLQDLPFPRTSRPVSVAVRVRSASATDEWKLLTTQGGQPQALVTARPGQVGAWHWLRFAPVYAGEVGDGLHLECWRGKGAVEPVAVDAVALGTTLPDDPGAAPALFGARPLVAVGRCAAPPAIDGRPDDACWANAIACDGFLTVGALAPAAADTQVKLCYDDDRLYLLYACPEPILDVAQQRRHEFAAAVTARDGAVYNDDSAVILLDPSHTGRQAFDFVVNARGTVADARCRQPDLWETRDLAWNAGVTAAGQVGDGQWSLELAVPFKDLGVSAPRPGDRWQVVLGRIAKARGETSSWNPSNRGFHDPAAMGTLLFGPPPGGLQLTAPRALQPGRNRLTAQCGGPAASPLTVWAALGGPRETRRHSQVLTASGEATFIIDQEADYRFAYGALDAATLAPRYLSPPVTRGVKSALATVHLTCDGPYELRLNDEPLSSGPSAADLAVRAPLQKGANVFAVKLANGTADVRLDAPGLAGRAQRWKLAPAGAREPLAAATNDSAWPLAPQQGRLTGQPGQPAVLRHTLLWEKTRLWPTPLPALHVARGTNQHLTVVADGLRGRPFGGWTVYLAVPTAWRVLGASGYYAQTPGIPAYTCTPVGPQTIGQQARQVVKVVADKPVVPGRHPIQSLFNAWVRCDDDGPDDETLSYWTEANDGTISEPLQTVKVKLLPRPAGKQPQRFVCQLWGSFFDALASEPGRRAVLETARDTGVNDLVAGNAWASENAPRYGLHNTMGVTFQSWSLDLKPYLDQHPAERLLRHDGKPDASLLCTTLLLGDGWPAVEQQLGEKMAKARPHVVDYDYEYSPYSGPHSCYCPRCLAAFRQFASLPADAPLDATVIRQRHAARWVDFMARRVAAVFARFKQAVHRLQPGCLFSVYSGYQTPENPEQYGVDWRYVGELQACDRIGCGYGRPVEAVRATVAAARGIPVLCGELLVPYETAKLEPVTPLSLATLLRRVLDATGGILLYERLSFDGRSWLALADLTRLVATHEPLFLTGRRTALPGQDESLVQGLTDGRTTLVCVLNPSSGAVTRTVPLPAAAGGGREFYTGRAVSAGETVRVELAAGGAAVFVLQP